MATPVRRARRTLGQEAVVVPMKTASAYGVITPTSQFNVEKAGSFLILFLVVAAITEILFRFFTRLSADSTWAGFVVVHSVGIVAFMKVPFSGPDLLWIALTLLHGAAHIGCPALFGQDVNPFYNPMYDFIVHAAQCLCVLGYHHDNFNRGLGIFMSISIYIGSAVAYAKKEFLETYLWLGMSGVGVYGTMYHMQLLNTKRDRTIYIASWILWSAPYLGYLVPGRIPAWDEFTNNIGLFRTWFLAYMVTMKLYGYLVEL
jgi:hypothetical protein